MGTHSLQCNVRRVSSESRYWAFWHCFRLCRHDIWSLPTDGRTYPSLQCSGSHQGTIQGVCRTSPCVLPIKDWGPRRSLSPTAHPQSWYIEFHPSLFRKKGAAGYADTANMIYRPVVFRRIHSFRTPQIRIYGVWHHVLVSRPDYQPIPILKFLYS